MRGPEDIVIITTYNRQKEVKELVERLENIFSGKIIVFDDGSEPPSEVADFYSQNHGKRRYFQLVTKIFGYLREQDFSRFYMLPDDIIPHENLFTRSSELWDAIKDDRKICLSVGHNHERHYKPCWTYFTPVKLGEVVLTGWNDLCFMAERLFLEELNYWIDEPLPGYDYRSSGVGRYISRTLHPNWNLYHVNKSLVDFPPNESRMQK